MAQQRGRFEEIYRQKTQGGESTFSALKSTAAERRKEKADLRRMFPNNGMIGAMLESAFGKAYKYNKGGNKRDVEASKNQPSFDDKTLTAIRMNTAIAAKNSMVLPGMARDMNVMRQNIVRMTKHATGSAATKADAHFMKAKEREASYEAALEKTSASKSSSGSAKTSIAGGGLFKSMFGGVGGLLGGAGSIIGGGASMIGSVLSGLGSLAGGAIGGIFRVLSGTLGGFGIGGILLAILGGSLLVSMYKGLNFGKYGAQFGEIFSAVGKSLKSFFGIDDKESGGKNIFERVASYLDDTFQTTGFSDGLKFIIQKWKDFSAEISYQISRLYNEIMVNATASFQAIGDIFMSIGKDIKSVFYKWLDENTPGFYTMIGAVVGSAAGLRGTALGAAIGAGAGMIQSRSNENREVAVKSLTDKQTDLQKRLDVMNKTNQTVENFTMIKKEDLETELKQTKQLLIDKKQEIEDRKGASDLAPFAERFKQYKDDARKIYPEMNRPSAEQTSPNYDNSSFDYKKYQELVGFKESGGKYGTDVGIGYVGKYGMGTSALEDLGLLKPGTHKKYGDKMSSAGIYHPEAWVEGMSLEKFLNSPEIQDDAMKRLTQKIRAYEEKEGIIKPGMSGTDIAERLYAQMHGSAKSLYMEGKVTEDFYFKGATNKKSAEWMKTMYAKSDNTITNQTEAINTNTNAVLALKDQMQEEKESTMTEILAALLQGMAQATTGTTVNNVNNTSVSNEPIASPYNDDMLTLFKQRASQGF